MAVEHTHLPPIPPEVKLQWQKRGGGVEIHKDKERGGNNSNTVFEARKLGGWGCPVDQ